MLMYHCQEWKTFRGIGDLKKMKIPLDLFMNRVNDDWQRKSKDSILNIIKAKSGFGRVEIN